MKGHYFFTLFFFIFLTLGPALPKTLEGHSMLEIQGDVFLFGGYGSLNHSSSSYYGYNLAIYQLSCSSGIYSWAYAAGQPSFGRRDLVAIPVPDTFCT